MIYVISFLVIGFLCAFVAQLAAIAYNKDLPSGEYKNSVLFDHLVKNSIFILIWPVALLYLLYLITVDLFKKD